MRGVFHLPGESGLKLVNSILGTKTQASESTRHIQGTNGFRKLLGAWSIITGCFCFQFWAWNHRALGGWATALPEPHP